MLLTITAAIAFTLYWVEFAELYVKFRLNFRPFNCSVCLAAWVGLALYFLPIEVSEAVCAMFIPGCLAPLIQKYL
jgi:hypothetical protein